MYPLITVIVPFFNAEKYLDRCLKSIVFQNYRNLQIILIDDGSTDNSFAIAKKYAESDTRCVLLTQTNKGVSSARNFGLKNALGEFVTFVDADDFIDSDYYETLVKFTDADIVQSGFKRVTTSGKTKILKSKSSYRFVSPWSKLIRHQFIVDHHIRFVEGERYEDVIFSLDLWINNPKIKVTNCIGYNYCANENSYTASKHDTKQLFRLMRQRLHQNMSVSKRILLYFTYIKLKNHFLFHLD